MLARVAVDRAARAVRRYDDMAPPLLPITRLIACPACAQHIKSSETQCPHCGAENRAAEGRAARAATAVLMGLALSGCPGKDPGPTTNSASGTDTEDSSGSGTETDTDTGSSTTGDASSGSGSGSGTDTMTMTSAEPEYGVPVTTSGEQDYGVPATDSDSGSGTGDATDTGGTGPEPLYGSGAVAP